VTTTLDATLPLSGALEDYLETVFLEVRRNGFARVRDIAKAREVKSSSVSVALGRLAELGLVTYAQREYVGLTVEGMEAARRVLARHELLARFFREILQMEAEAAEREACAMEHTLSPEAMDRLVRFFEFLHVCPEGRTAWLERFHACSLVQSPAVACATPCPGRSADPATGAATAVPLSTLEPWQPARVRQVTATGAVRRRLLDLGLLPDAGLRVERVAPTGDPMWIELAGSQLALRRREADSVLVERA